MRLFFRVVEECEWTVIIVVHLTTHWHAIVETPDFSLADGMQFLNGEYSRRFNERHLRVGYLVRDRYWSRRKKTEAELLGAYCYAANNPVLAGLAARAEDWRWSSFAASVGLSDAFGFVDASRVLALYGNTLSEQRVGLRRHVAELADAERRRRMEVLLV